MATSEDSKRYAATEKGKETAARKNEKAKLERKAVKMLRGGGGDARGQAKFSKRYTVYNEDGVKQAERVNTNVNQKMNELNLKGKKIVTIKRHYRRQIAESPECVQGGISRWSESILNPAYRKKHNLPTPKRFAELVEDMAYEMSLGELRELIVKLRKLIAQKPR